MMTDRELLINISNKLKLWVKQTESGGWSTHQVKPQKELSDMIDLHLYRTNGPNKGYDEFRR